jgi:hypothetical protein
MMGDRRLDALGDQPRRHRTADETRPSKDQDAHAASRNSGLNRASCYAAAFA